MVRSRSEYYTSMSVSSLPTFLISVKNMNLLSSSIYKHLKTYLIKQTIFDTWSVEVNLFLCSVIYFSFNVPRFAGARSY